jgi:hypothetical protein
MAGLIPIWFRPWMAWVLAVLALAWLLAAQTVRLSREQAAHAKTVADHATYVAQLEHNAREAVQAARDEERRRTVAVQEIADDTQKKLEVAAADAVAARDAGDRLRKQIAILAAAGRRAAASKAGAAEAGAPADATADLLADVQRRLDQATDGIAEFADRAHAAGLGCQRSYDALN